MKYHTGLLNTHGYFLRLASSGSLPNYDEKLASLVEQFLYRASCILSSLHSMHEAEKQTVMLVRTYIKQIQFGEDKKVAVSAEPLFFVYAQIPACLSLLVAMQNDMLVIFQKIFGIKRLLSCKIVISYNFILAASNLLRNFSQCVKFSFMYFVSSS